MSKIATNKTKLKQKIEELEKQSELMRHELENELEVTKGKVTDIAKIVLGIGGGLLFAIIVLNNLTGKKRKNGEHYKSKKVYQRFRDQLTHELTGQATDFLLGLAKDKLTSYIDKKETVKDEDSDITG